MSGAKAVKPRPGRLLMGLPPETRVVIADVTWNDYARLVDAVAEGENCRVAYDGKDVELMNVGPVHDSYSEILGLFVNLVAEELQIDLRGARSTTWRRRKLNRGIEADLSYFVDAAKVAAFDAALARRSGKSKITLIRTWLLKSTSHVRRSIARGSMLRFRSLKSGVFSRSTCRSSNCNLMGSMWRLSAAGSFVSHLTTWSAGSCGRFPR